MTGLWKFVRLVLFICVEVVVVATSANAQSSSSAPFGLSWGASSKDVSALGASLTKVDLADYGVTYAASNLPKTLSDVQTIFLSFGHDDKLWRIAAVSREFERDGYGSAVSSRYEELKLTLSKRYGEPQKLEQLSSDDYYRKPDNFVYGIYSNENSWISLFDTPDINLELSIGASGTNDSFWRLIYISKLGKKAFDTQHISAETDAL